jgi:hypothetical protein
VLQVSRFWVIVVILTVQVVSAFFFISDIVSSYVGFWTQPIPWELRELLEIGSAIGLSAGVAFGAIVLINTHRHRNVAEARLRAASGAFVDLLQERFTEWDLTRRGTSEGTVKAQTNAIYRKAGVSGRSQLLSLFIDDLMRDDSTVRAALVEPAAAIEAADSTRPAA